MENAKITLNKILFKNIGRDPIIQMNAFYFPYSNIIFPIDAFEKL